MTDGRTMDDEAMDDVTMSEMGRYPDPDWGVPMDGRHHSQVRQRAGIRPRASCGRQ